MPVPDHAATVLLLRDADPFEVLMVSRNSRGAFGNIDVFPGGAVDDIDIPPQSAVEDEVSHRHAAVRELAEESGIVLTDSGVRSAAGHRGAEFYRWASEEGITLGIQSLVLVSRWVTPEQAPRRFDTLFFLAHAPAPPEVTIDTAELVGYHWVTPSQAISRAESGETTMILPTVAHLRWLAKRSSIQDAFESARGADGRSLIMPRIEQDGSLIPIHLPAEIV